MSPIPSTRTIHPDWSKHHYTTVGGSLTAAGRVLRRGEGEGVFDPVTGDVQPPADILVYPSPGPGPAPMRIQALNVGVSDAEVGDQLVPVNSYLIVIRHDAAQIKAGEDEDWVIVDTCEDDIQLVGKRFSIESVTYGSLRWERDLICQYDLARNQ